MPRRSSPRNGNLRLLVAQEAARLIDEQGLRDYGLAKRKAAERLGVAERGSLPGNTEIEEALAERQRLFAGPERAELIRAMRQVAHRAMELFDAFEPRLVGPVLNGTASDHSDVNLHLFANAPEEVAVRLIQDGIPYHMAERRMRVGGDRYQMFPVFRFVAGEVAIDATVFPTDGIRQSPNCPIDGRPMRRAALSEVALLLEP